LSVRNLIAVILAILAGILLIVSGTRGPVGIFEIVLQKLSQFTNDATILLIASTIALILIVLSSVGGFIVIIGGYLIFMNHIKTGKLAISMGAGIGIPWLIFIIATIIITGEPQVIITQHSILGWTGIILALIARIIAK